jgi:hypothetical protein
MSVVGHWPVGPARWLDTVGILTRAGGVFAILYAAWPPATQDRFAHAVAVVALVLTCAWAICRILKARPLASTLILHECGLWALQGSLAPVQLTLTHAWPAFGWITLRFHEGSARKASRPIELTIWKTCVSSAAWGQLCVHVARQTAMPERRLNKESS